MNEFEEQAPMDYIDESVPAMVEQQGDFQDIEHSYQADGTVGADDNGSFLDEDGDVDIVTADGQEYSAEDGREGAGQPLNRGKGGYLQKSTPRYNSPGQVAGRVANKVKGEATQVGKQATAAVGDVVNSAKSIGNTIKNNRGKVGVAAGLAAAGAGAAAYAKHKKDQENREGGRFGEGEFDETYEAPYTGEVEEQVVDYSDSVEANYASIQAAVNYAMQDNRL